MNTLSSLACTKLQLTKWLDYAKCRLFDMSIRKSYEIIDMCVNELDKLVKDEKDVVKRKSILIHSTVP